MQRWLPYVAAVIGVLALALGATWAIDPGRAAEALRMPLLEGLALSTQIGDLGAFFSVLGLCVLVGLLPGQARLLWVAAALVGVAGAFRTVAWAVHGADLAWLFIGGEALMTAVLAATAWARTQRRRSADGVPEPTGAVRSEGEAGP